MLKVVDKEDLKNDLSIYKQLDHELTTKDCGNLWAADFEIRMLFTRRTKGLASSDVTASANLRKAPTKTGNLIK
ncbi:hypothetical protein [Bradyrhizobium sp. Gha]|uniref:hypothetical protein n=1 Tax=Bradyrhizobium sp. Gha TaxID=1855318 RepID=UPI0008E4896C|nr:hypothetical protein [Bradyrhizobium sp. Gha]SFI63467.1 hypothetical protein SAMN05216525_111122 [Bradyrhizobium sp. Gha]